MSLPYRIIDRLPDGAVRIEIDGREVTVPPGDWKGRCSLRCHLHPLVSKKSCSMQADCYEEPDWDKPGPSCPLNQKENP